MARPIYLGVRWAGHYKELCGVCNKKEQTIHVSEIDGVAHCRQCEAAWLEANPPDPEGEAY